MVRQPPFADTNLPVRRHLGSRDVFGLVQGKQDCWRAMDGAWKLVIFWLGASKLGKTRDACCSQKPIVLPLV